MINISRIGKEIGWKIWCIVLAAVFVIHISGGLDSYADNDKDADDQTPKIALEMLKSGEGYSAVLYDNTNGLPTSEANAVVSTSDGAVWIGSYSGLIRCDGSSFERIDSVTGISSVCCLYVDSRDRLWIGTNDGGAAVMEKGDFVRFNKSEGMQSSSVRAITEDESGRIYLATTHGISVVDENMRLYNIDEPQINDEFIRDLKTGADGILYGLTMSGSVFTLTNDKVASYYAGSKIGIPNIHTILPDPENPGMIYIGTTRSRVYHGSLADGFKDPTAINASPLESLNSINVIDGNIWICGNKGIGIVDGNSTYMLSDVPLNNSIDTMMKDYQGNYWFTSSRQGVMKLVPNQFTDIFRQYGLEPEVVNSTCRVDDKLFIGADNGLIVITENGVEQRIPLKDAATASGERIIATDLIQFLKGCKIRSIVRDSKGALWFSTFGHNALIKYYDGTITKFGTADGMPSDRVRAVYECEDGTIMAACTGGLAIIKDDKVVAVDDESSGLTNTELLTVTEAENGDILLGTDGDGIYVISDSNTLHLGTESGLESEVIMRIKKDAARDIYWIVTSNSIAYMDSSYNITTIDKFPYSNNFDMYENSSGEMWILSSNGVYIASIDELLENGDISTIFYGKDNGLPCIAMSNSYSDLTENGDLYIAGTTGVAKVNIERSSESVSEVKMSLPYVDADGERIYADSSGTIKIPSDVNKITIYGYVYAYSLMNPQVTYYLEGFESNRTTLRRSELQPVSYTNLSGGKYSFVMQLKDSRGHKEITLYIIKEKAIYEKVWFRVLCVIASLLLIGGLVALYIRHRIKSFRKKEQEDKAFIREMIEAFAKTIDMKDKYTKGHSSRVAEYTAMLTKELGYDENTIEKYYNIALLHDIGKIGTPPEVLNKPGKLTDQEFNIIKAHSALGYNVLKDISIMPELAIGAGAHHERPDGKGYPKGLKGDEIPRVAQIIAVADTFDAMYSDRPYRKRMNFDKAVSIMKEVSGTQLTSDVVEAFLRLVERGNFRDPEDSGGGTTEDIDNIHKKFHMSVDNVQNKKD